MTGPIQRELKVAFSRKAQPVWFRILKWIVIVVIFIRFRQKPHFWYWVLVAFAFSVALHMFYRWKTHTWTRPWGGWNDLDALR